MHKYLNIGSIEVPTYGVMVLFGIVVVNIIAGHIVKKNKLDLNRYVLIELIGGIGAIAGAKTLAVLEKILTCSNDVIIWELFHKSGYSYLGGLFGFLLFLYIYYIFTGINIRDYAERMTFLLPLLHVFWKIGCFFGGCCRGILYSGAGRLPIQLIEALTALVICIFILVQQKLQWFQCSIALYLVLYGSSRFVLEFFRHHSENQIFSVAHVLSLFCTVIGFCIWNVELVKRCRNDRAWPENI